MTDKDIQKVKIDTIQSLIDSIRQIRREYLTINDLERIKKELMKLNS